MRPSRCSKYQSSTACRCGSSGGGGASVKAACFVLTALQQYREPAGQPQVIEHRERQRRFATGCLGVERGFAAQQPLKRAASSAFAASQASRSARRHRPRWRRNRSSTLRCAAGSTGRGACSRPSAARRTSRQASQSRRSSVRTDASSSSGASAAATNCSHTSARSKRNVAWNGGGSSARNARIASSIAMASSRLRRTWLASSQCRTAASSAASARRANLRSAKCSRFIATVSASRRWSVDDAGRLRRQQRVPEIDHRVGLRPPAGLGRCVDHRDFVIVLEWFVVAWPVPVAIRGIDPADATHAEPVQFGGAQGAHAGRAEHVNTLRQRP